MSSSKKKHKQPQCTKTLKQLSDELLVKLNERNLGAYLWHEATTTSVYIRFEDNRLGSVRIANHDGIDKYKYKFNVRTDMNTNGWVKDGDIWRFYVRWDNLDLLVEQIVLRSESAKNWEASKYQYGIPSWKKDTKTTT